MRSNSESLATKCFTVHADALRLHAGDVRHRHARREVRILGVALEVAARERVAVDVHRRREQRVRLLAPAPRRRAAAPTSCTSSGFHVAPSAVPHGKFADGRARPLLAPRAARTVGDLQRRDARALDRRAVPQVDARGQRRLLVERQLDHSSSIVVIASSLAGPRLRLPPCARWNNSTARSRSSPARAAGSGGRSSRGSRREGMRVVAADIEAGALAETAAERPRPRSSTIRRRRERLRRRRRARRPRVRDVRRGRRAVQQRGRVRGRLHVGAAGRPTSTWTLGVNLWGILNAIRAFVPRMIAAGTPGAHRQHRVDGRAVHERRSPGRTRSRSSRRSPRPNASPTISRPSGAPIKVSAVVPGRGRHAHRRLEPQPPGVTRGRHATDDAAFVEQALADLTTRAGRRPARSRRLIVDAIRTEHVPRADASRATRSRLRRRAAPRSSTARSRRCRTSTETCVSRVRGRGRRKLARERRGFVRTGRASARSIDSRARGRTFTPSQRSGSGSHSRRRWPTHGSRTRSVSRPRMRSAIVRPARFVVLTPSPT